MQSTATTPPPPGMNYISSLGPSLSYLLVGTVFSSFLIPIGLALLFFSNSRTRRQPIFLLNMLALSVGIALNIVNVYIEIHSMLSPATKISNASTIAFPVLSWAGPVLVECILLVRLVAVFPPKITSRAKLVAIFAFPIANKAGRLVIWGIYMYRYSTLSIASNSSVQGGEKAWVNTLLTINKVEWILELFDNAYISALFLYRLRGRRSPAEPMTVLRSPSMARRIRGLFFVALSNFVFPVVFSIAQLILLCASPNAAENYVRTGTVYLANVYVNIISVVFATVWTTGTSWQQAQGLADPDEDESATPSFAELHVSVLGSHHVAQPPSTHEKAIVPSRRSTSSASSDMHMVRGEDLGSKDVELPVQVVPTGLVHHV
ncbi:hypothetical protein PLICRDRAFT_528752 [Plicaturopsis crispa FD-325 SS-3]|nr:hypothetical protein PLICRDRAFT_528752 [Plicaturopsis crispa FD-325 SS-3]